MLRSQSVLAIPPLVYTIPLLRALLPTSAFDRTCELLGVSSSMDEFKGRK
jgi:hypothetical protein